MPEGQHQRRLVSVSIFCRAVLLEVFDGTINLDPIMFRLVKNRSDGRHVFWIYQRADRNADHRRQVVGLPADRRPAVWAKIGVDLPAACRITSELFWRSGDGDSANRIKDDYTKWRAGSPLAFKTMAGDANFDGPGSVSVRALQLHRASVIGKHFVF